MKEKILFLITMVFCMLLPLIPTKVLAEEVPTFDLSNFEEDKTVNDVTLTQIEGQEVVYNATIESISKDGTALNTDDALLFQDYELSISIKDGSDQDYTGAYVIRYDNRISTLTINGTIGSPNTIHTRSSDARNDVVITSFENTITEFETGKKVSDVSLTPVGENFEITNYFISEQGDAENISPLANNTVLENKAYYIVIEVDALGHTVDGSATFNVGTKSFNLGTYDNKSVYIGQMNTGTNYVLDGDALISGTLKYNQQITASLTNSTANSNNLEYTWYRGEELITGQTTNKYTLVEADINKTIKVVITSTEKFVGSKIFTTTTTVKKADGPEAPNTPVFKSSTNNSITVVANTGLEYSVNGTDWSTTGIITGLDAETDYSVVARVAATNTTKASVESETLTAKTAKVEGDHYLLTVNDGTGSGLALAGASISVTANDKTGKAFTNWTSTNEVTFVNETSKTTTFTMPSEHTTITANYEDISVTSVVITPSTATIKLGSNKKFTATVNGTGNPSQDVTWSITGNNSNETKVDKNGLLTIANDETSKTVKLTTTSKLDNTKSGKLTVTIEKLDCTETPKKAVLKKVNNQEIHVVLEKGHEYSIDGNTWYDTGIIPVDANTLYNVKSRIKETTNTKASPAATEELNVQSQNTSAFHYILTIYKKGDTNNSTLEYHPENESVNIAAGTIDGFTFKEWITTDGVTFTDANLSSTSFTMPTKSITVKATFVKNEVTKLTITPRDATFELGNTVKLTATLTSSGTVNKGIAWTLENNTSDDTKINSDGLVTVASDEKSETLTVTATSLENNKIKDSVDIKLLVKEEVKDEVEEEVKPTVKPTTPSYSNTTPEKVEDQLPDKEEETIKVYLLGSSNITVTKGNKENINIKLSSKIEKLKLILNDEMVLASNYELTNDAKTLSLKEDYVSKLPVGEHEFTLYVGEDKISFTINIEDEEVLDIPKEEEKEQTEEPKKNNLFIYIIGTCLLALLLVLFLNREKEA